MPEVVAARKARRPVLIVEAFQTGGAVAARTRTHNHWLTFNPSDDQARVHDITQSSYEFGAEWLGTFERSELPMPPKQLVRVIHALIEGLVMQRILTPAQVVTDEAELKRSSVDNFRKLQNIFGVHTMTLPAAVVMVRSTEEVARVLAFADEHGVNVVARTGGTATEGGLESGAELSIVVDGSAISANLGVNPSLTITAQAERAMAFWPNKGETDPRPPLGAAYERISPVPPTHPAVAPTAPAALRLPIVGVS